LAGKLKKFIFFLKFFNLSFFFLARTKARATPAQCALFARRAEKVYFFDFFFRKIEKIGKFFDFWSNKIDLIKIDKSILIDLIKSAKKNAHCGGVARDLVARLPSFHPSL